MNFSKKTSARLFCVNRDGMHSGCAEAITAAVRMCTPFVPGDDRERCEEKYRRFLAVYDGMKPVFSGA